MSGLQLLPFLSYYGKTNMEKGSYPPLPPPTLGSNTLSLTAFKTLWKTTDSASIDN